ncbi:MAG: hypothetical protein HYV27_15340 [Candidatus Hydrogenedentes bacterium]|nr:hypothetical protein [Candidatus Hydrogenedentota bacterium]
MPELSKYLNMFAERLRLHPGGAKVAPTKLLEAVEDNTEGAATVAAEVVAYFQNNATSATDLLIALLSGTAGEAGIVFGDKDGQQGKLYFDNVTGSIIIKTSTGIFTIDSTGSVTMTKAGGNAWLAVNETATNNTVAQTAAIRATLTSGSLADGFGPGLAFQNRTGAGGAVRMGILTFVRAGADNTADFVVRPDAAGSGAEKFRVGSDGKITIPGYIINAGIRAVSATGAASAPELGHASHTPAGTNVANAPTITPGVFRNCRVGNGLPGIVGQFTCVPTAGSTLTKVGLSLPLSSNLAAAGDLRGLANCISPTLAGPVSVYVDTTNDRIEVAFTSNGTGTHTIDVVVHSVVI